MSTTPTGSRFAKAGVGLAVAAAIAAGTLVARDQLVSTSAVHTAGENVRVAEQNAKAKVPFNGPFARNHKGITECGPSVRLMSGALRKTKPPIRKTPAANCVGLATERQLKAFQKRHDIPQSGIYGTRTHAALAHAYTKKQIVDLAYLARKHVLAVRYATIVLVTAHAKLLEARMQYCNNGSLGFCTLRTVWPPWPDVPHNADCSAYVQWVYFQSGLPNPNGFGVGSTKTLINHGVTVPPGAPLHIGDLVFYGANNSHVAIYTGHGLISSHGQARIRIAPYGYRKPIYSIKRYFG
jgi:hypothetical protein